VLWVQTQSGEIFGPWPDEQLKSIAAFARIGSKTGQPRRLMRGTRKPTDVIRIYDHGKRVWPKSGEHLRGLNGASTSGRLIAAAAGSMVGFGVGAELERATTPKGEGFLSGLDRSLTFRVAGTGIGALGGLYLSEKLSENGDDE